MIVYLNSYPKSGNTWMRFLVGNLMFPKVELNFETIEEIVPDLHKIDSGESVIKKDLQLYKSHLPFQKDHKNVIYVVRNPLSVCVSLYFHAKKYKWKSGSKPFEIFVERFLNGKVLKAFGSWQDNVLSWCDNAENIDKFLLLRYEDLLENPKEELKKIATFLDLKRSEEDLDMVIEKSSFEKMKKLEKVDSGKSKHFKIGRTNEVSDQNIAFVRSGKADEYLSYFTEKTKNRMLKEFSLAIHKMGYEELFEAPFPRDRFSFKMELRSLIKKFRN